MAFVSDSIPNLVGGVSQQAPTLRLASQCEEQVSFEASIVEGLGRRPPTRHVAQLDSYDGELTAEIMRDAAIHTIDRDATEQYKVLIYGETIRVFDFTGDEKVVNTPDGTGYLACTRSKTALSLTSVADYTLIVNREVVVEMDDPVSDTRGVEALVFVLLANYATHYKVTLDGYTATCATEPWGYAAANHISPTGGDGTAEEPVAVSTEFVARCIAEDLIANHPNTGNYQISYSKSVVWIRRVNKAAFVCEALDSRGNTNIKLAKERVTRLSDLPLVAPPGFEIEVAGDPSTPDDNYYVTFRADNTGLTLSQGGWGESVKPGISVGFDLSTMPHQLVREENGEFTFQRGDYGDRVAGSEISAPDPTFVNHTIADVLFVRNRLGFLADENAILSRSGSFFDFFPASVTVLTDDDPIDKSAGHKKVSLLNYAVPFKKRLFFFSDKTQFELKYGDILSNETADIVPITEYESDTQCRPIGAGKGLFFPIRRGRHTGIQEFYVADELEAGDANEVTAHVPTYIPARASKLAVATNEETLFVCAGEDSRSLYVYKFYWGDNEKLQSAWMRYDFYHDGSEILDAEFTVDACYMIVSHPDGVFMESLSVAPNRSDPDQTFEFQLDRKVNEELCTTDYDSGSDTTTITAPFLLTDRFMVVARFPADHTKTPGNVATTVSIDEDEIIVRGDWTAAKFYVGERYLSRYVFSPQYLRKGLSTGGREIVSTGRLQMKFWTFHYARTGYFEIIVKPLGGEEYRYPVTTMAIGAPDTIVGNIPINSGQVRIPIMAKNDEVEITIESDSHLPLHMLSIEWEGDYTTHSQRV